MHFWRRAAGVVAALALAAAGYVGWRLNYRPWAPGVVRRLPASETLLYLNLRTLRGALPAAPLHGSGYAAFVRDSGFDFTRDVDQLGLALRGDPAHPASACAVLEGRFGAKFAAYLRAHAQRRLNLPGLAAWQFPGLARPRQTMTVALVAPDVLAVTNAAAPAADLARARGGWNGAPALWQAAFWRPRPVAYVAADTLALAAERDLNGGLPPWQGAQRMAVSLRLAPPDRLRLEATEQAGDAAAAAREQAWLEAALKPLAAELGQAQAPPAGAQLAALLRRLRFRRDGSRLRASLSLSAPEARNLLRIQP